MTQIYADHQDADPRRFITNADVADYQDADPAQTILGQRESAFGPRESAIEVLHEIDATNQPLGRLASKIAVILRGKNNPNYQPNVMPQEKVVVENIAKIKFTGKKMDQKIYYHYSGYPGGMKARKLRDVFARDPKRVLWMAVNRMLAKNRLRSRIMKNLIIQ